MFGAELRCKVCNLYTPDRCVCDKDPALKGIEGGNCNRTACQRPEAYYYNVGSRAYYCLECAEEINEFAMRDHADGTQMNLFPDLGKVRHEQRKKRQVSNFIIQADFSALEERILAQACEPTVYRFEDALPGKKKAQWKSERQGQSYPKGRK